MNKSFDINEGPAWGQNTQRALENFHISSYHLSPALISSFAVVKKACALTNAKLNFLDADIADAIIAICDRIIAGELNHQFRVDPLQGGAGTSTNMNLNEVIANLASKSIGKDIAALEDVNLHQSTNDTYPTALKIAAIFGLRKLSSNCAELQSALQAKETEFSHIIKMGRTEMQDALPMTLGAQFSSFAAAFERDRWRTFKSEERLRTVNIGGTAIGSGLGAPRKYIFEVIEQLRGLTGIGLTRADFLIDQTANCDCFVEVSGMLNALAVNLIKVSRDLRLMATFGEINLPTLQPGSSIMPGKVNPVILECIIQTGIKIKANDFMVNEAAALGTLQINEFMPLISFALLESLEIAANAVKTFSEHIKDIGANDCSADIDNNLRLITAFVPYLGYNKAEKILDLYKTENKNISFKDFLKQQLGEKEVEQILSSENLLSLGFNPKNNPFL